MDDLTLQSQWNEMNDMIERWQEERQELLVKYCELTEIIDFFLCCIPSKIFYEYISSVVGSTTISDVSPQR